MDRSYATDGGTEVPQREATLLERIERLELRQREHEERMQVELRRHEEEIDQLRHMLRRVFPQDRETKEPSPPIYR